MTKQLLLPPDESHRRAEPRLRRTKTGGVVIDPPYQRGTWIMSSRGHVHSRRLETHVKWVLRQLEGKEPALGELLQGDARGGVFCYSAGSTPKAPSIPKMLAARIEELGLAFSIDPYEI